MSAMMCLVLSFLMHVSTPGAASLRIRIRSGGDDPNNFNKMMNTMIHGDKDMLLTGMGSSFQRKTPEVAGVQPSYFTAPENIIKQVPTVDKFERAGRFNTAEPAGLKVSLKGSEKFPVWHDKGSLKKHFEKHGEEFPEASTNKEYSNLAKEFAASTEKAVVVKLDKLKTTIKIEGGRFEDGKLVFEHECKVLITKIGKVKTFYKWDHEKYPENPLGRAVKSTVKLPLKDADDAADDAADRTWREVEKVLKEMEDDAKAGGAVSAEEPLVKDFALAGEGAEGIVEGVVVVAAAVIK